MKVALVLPSSNLRLNVSSPPLNLGYLASFLRKYTTDVEVAIIDGAIGQNIEKRLVQFQPDIVGITFTTPLAPFAYRMVRWIRNIFSDVFIIMGGVHATVLADEVLQYCDTVVRNDGEVPLLNIVNAIQKGIKPPRIIDGNQQIITNLDAIPSPAFDLLDLESYFLATDNPGFAFPFGLKNARTGTIMTSRGCPFRCIFCYNSWRETKVRYHSADRVISEILYFIERHKVNSMFFLDDEFVVNKRRLKELNTKFKEYNIEDKIVWGCQARVSSLDHETMRLAKEMGCKFVSVGFESANERILKLLKVGSTTLKQNFKVLEDAKKVGLNIGGSFIFGSPTETKEEMLETLKFIEDNDELAFLGINVLIPYPGTQAYYMCQDMKLLPRDIDYTKLVPTNKASDTYIVCNTMPKRKFISFMNDIFRIAYTTQKIRLIYKSSERPVRDLLKLFKHKIYWYLLFRHPLRFLKLFRKVSTCRR